MGKPRFTEEQKLRIVREHFGGADMTMLCRRHGVSSTTVYKWRSRHAGVGWSDLRRLRSLEAENARLKILPAESVLEVSRLNGLLEANFYGLWTFDSISLCRKFLDIGDSQARGIPIPTNQTEIHPTQQTEV